MKEKKRGEKVKGEKKQETTRERSKKSIVNSKLSFNSLNVLRAVLIVLNRGLKKKGRV
jgi:hypothetical protein